jgi:iron complex transport system substrate-binding protein
MKQFLFAFIVIALAFSSCNQKQKSVSDVRIVTDMLGRKVEIPEKIDRVVGVRAGALRMLTYMGAADKVVGIEEHERRDLRPYTIAYPALLNLPLIGPMMGGDSELILQANPDVIFMSYATRADADGLEKRTGIPVIAIDCPELVSHRNILYQSLRLMGQVFSAENRADSIINFFEQTIVQLDSITSLINDVDKPKVYVGGVSYSGTRDITSTQAFYPPFEFVNAKNVAQEIAAEKISHVRGTFIDIEQLLVWNPDVLFIDNGGIELVNKSVREKKILKNNIAAFKNKQVYVVYAYNNYATNYEMIFANSWYVAKVLYPSQFEQIDIKQKVNQITQFLLGKAIYDDLQRDMPAFTNYIIQE